MTTDNTTTDNTTTNPDQETPMADTQTTEAPTPAPAFALTVKPTAALVDYLKRNVSADADAPHRGFPFIDAKDKVRVKPDHFEGWFRSESALFTGTPGKRDVRAVLKDAGLVQKVYPLPAHPEHPELTGKSFGLYTGPVPAGAKNLPHRVVARSVATSPGSGKNVEVTQDGEGNTTVKGVPAKDVIDAGARAAQRDAAPESGIDIGRVEASTLKVGDVIGTTGSNTRQAIEGGEGEVIAKISVAAGRVQARDADGKIIRSMAPDTKVWRVRTA